MTRRRSSTKIQATVAAGLLAGFAASFAMNLAMRVAAVASFPQRSSQGAEQRRKRLGKRVREFIELGDPNEEILGQASLLLFHRSFPAQWKIPAATLAHYSFGTLLGAAYSLGVETFRPLASGSGAAAALLWWAAVNEILLPASGLLRSRREMPMRAHLAMLASHVVYGITLEQARRTLRRAENA